MADARWDNVFGGRPATGPARAFRWWTRLRFPDRETLKRSIAACGNDFTEDDVDALEWDEHGEYPQDPDEDRDEHGNSSPADPAAIHEHLEWIQNNPYWVPDRPPDAGPNSAWGLGFADAQSGRRSDPESRRPRNARDASQWAAQYGSGYEAGRDGAEANAPTQGATWHWLVAGFLLVAVLQYYEYL